MLAEARNSPLRGKGLAPDPRAKSAAARPGVHRHRRMAVGSVQTSPPLLPQIDLLLAPAPTASETTATDAHKFPLTLGQSVVGHLCFATALENLIVQPSFVFWGLRWPSARVLSLETCPLEDDQCDFHLWWDAATPLSQPFPSDDRRCRRSGRHPVRENSFLEQVQTDILFDVGVRWAGGYPHHPCSQNRSTLSWTPLVEPDAEHARGFPLSGLFQASRPGLESASPQKTQLVASCR